MRNPSHKVNWYLRIKKKEILLTKYKPDQTKIYSHFNDYSILQVHIPTRLGDYRNTTTEEG